MRSLLIVCVIVLMAGVANAAAPGQISDNALAQMGLSGMQTMSDAQGSQIRGMGFVSVQGSVGLNLGGICAGSSYVAVGCSQASGGASVGVGIGQTSIRGCCSSVNVCGLVLTTTATACAR
jgi:hypothetical protein